MRWVKRAVLLIRKFMYKMNRDRIKAYSAGAAFFIIMSFFPFLMLLLALVQYTPLTQEQIVMTLEEITPLGLTEELKQIVEGVYSQASALLPWTAIVAVWSAGKGVLGLSDGLNAVFQIKETRNYFMSGFLYYWYDPRIDSWLWYLGAGLSAAGIPAQQHPPFCQVFGSHAAAAAWVGHDASLSSV